jgi:hypothetical protein
MAVSVIHKRSQPGLRRLAVPSLLGDGLPERLRSTSIALLGAVAAIGLGTVAFALQLGLPPVASGPLPDLPVKPAVAPERNLADGERERTATVDRSTRPTSSRTDPEPVPSPSAAERSRPAAPVAPPTSEATVVVTESAPARVRPERVRPVDEPVADRPPATVATPTATPPVEPSASSSDVPEPAPEPEPEAPAPSHPGNGNAYGKGHGNGLGNGGVPPGQAAKESRGSEAGE